MSVKILDVGLKLLLVKKPSWFQVVSSSWFSGGDLAAPNVWTLSLRSAIAVLQKTER